MRYIRYVFLSKQETILLEIKIPQEVKKSPAAMEIFLSALYQKGAATFIDTYLGGKVPPWFSLELVSIGGDVHMFIWAFEKYRTMIEHQLYAQYPNVEIYEVDDYTKGIPHDPDNWPMWATYFKLSQADAYPIKTYIDYGLDKDQEEEYKIDPMTAVLEYLGSLKKGEQCWIQILLAANKSEGLGEGRLKKKPDWKKDVEKEIEKVMEPFSPGEGKFPRPQTRGEQDKLAALERSLSKPAFDCAIRGVYISEKESFNPGVSIPGLIGTFRQYSSNTMNGFRLGKFTDFDYPWQDFRRMRRNKIEKQMLEAYKLRSFFQEPYKFFKQKPFILTTEEVATIFHMPSGIAVQTPTFTRVPSKKAEPPSNLPL
ncbi:MAG: hypothetical protein MRY49_01255 [Candidatus Pacebacteria bacterium]|nr:hypothetical protein [Candidatus Paceibacterota bacterium]